MRPNVRDSPTSWALATGGDDVGVAAPSHGASHACFVALVVVFAED